MIFTAETQRRGGRRIEIASLRLRVSAVKIQFFSRARMAAACAW